MAESKTNCPKCGGHIITPKELAGQEIACPHCSENILLAKSNRIPAWILITIIVVTVAAFGLIGFWKFHKQIRQNVPDNKQSEFEVLKDKAAKGDSESMVELGRLYLYGNGVPTNTDNGLEWVGNDIPTNSNLGLEWLQKAAALGNTDAMIATGDVYYQKWEDENSTNTSSFDPATGLPAAQSLSNSPTYSESLKWYEKAADLGDTNAMWKIIVNGNVGSTNFTSTIIHPITGLPIASPNEEGLRWLRKLAERGDTVAMVQIAVLDLDQSNTDQGLKWLQKAAELGDTIACTTLASKYEMGGGGVTKDIQLAVWWYTKAANKGDIASESQLADIYREDPILKNPKASFNLFLKIAKLPDTNTLNLKAWELVAQHYVAQYYDNGFGVDQDKNEAIKWYKKAAESGDSEAQWRLGVKYDVGDGVDMDKQKALQWYLKAANWSGIFGSPPAGVAESERNLGYFYRDGVGVTKDNQEAFKWFQKAASNGEAHSQYELGRAYYTGIGVLQDKTEAFNWYQKAANQGDKAAQFALGNIYGQNLNSSLNRIEAHKWFALAAAQGDEDAAKLRDIIAPTMSAQELAEAGKQARAFSAGKISANDGTK